LIAILVLLIYHVGRYTNFRKKRQELSLFLLFGAASETPCRNSRLLDNPPYVRLAGAAGDSVASGSRYLRLRAESDAGDADGS
jgi:hypothetical protein